MSLTGKSYFMGSGPEDVREALELREAAVEAVLPHLGAVHPVVRTEVEILVDVFLAAGEYSGPSPKGIALTRDQLRSFIKAAEGGDFLQIKTLAGELWANSAINIPLLYKGFPFSMIKQLVPEGIVGRQKDNCQGRFIESDVVDQDWAAQVTEKARCVAGAILEKIPRQKVRWPSTDKPFDDLILGLAAHFEQQTGMPARAGIKKRGALYEDVWGGPFFDMMCDLCYALDLPIDPQNSPTDHASFGKRIVRSLA